MGLAEKLTARAARQGRSAPVECGELGTVTVEALPVRELELLLRGSDGQRAVFYGACRELQSAGEELRKAGKIFRPDQVMQFVSDSEAAAAAWTVLELSGQAAQNYVDPALHRASDVCENGLPFVQEKAGSYEGKTAENMGENRLAPVQYNGTIVPLTDGNRLEPVQNNEGSVPGFGQVSRETEAASVGFDTIPESDKKAQAMGILPTEWTQNVVTKKSSSPTGDGSDTTSGGALHEIESEFGDGLHGIKSEFQSGTPETVNETMSGFQDGLHETTSDFRKTLHESKSDFGEIRRVIPHEIKSEFKNVLHESTLESGGEAHETTSEFQNSLHETESELAEKVARRLVEGLRRAKWVRGD